MSKSKYTDRICALILVFTLAVTLVFMNGEKVGIVKAESDIMADEDGIFSDRDFKENWSEKNAISIALGDIEGLALNGAYEMEGNLYLVSKGTYVLSGKLENHQIIVNAKGEKIQIVLNGVELLEEDSPAIQVEKADKVFMTLAEDSENRISVGKIANAEESGLPDAAIFSTGDLTINGSGSLNVSVESGHGIKSKDDLVVTNGVLTVNASGTALLGKDSVRIAGGTFDLTAGTDGIKANNDSNEEKGYVTITGGTFDIKAEHDGIQAETDVNIEGGDIQILSGGGYENGKTHMEEFGMGGRDGEFGGGFGRDFGNMFNGNGEAVFGSDQGNFGGRGQGGFGNRGDRKNTWNEENDGQTEDRETQQPTENEMIEMPDGTQMPSNGEMPQMPGGMQMPSNGEMPQMPEGMQMPSNGEMPQMPEGMQRPSNGEMPQMPGGMQLPSDGEMPQMSGGMQLPSDGEMPQMPGGMQMPSDGEMPQMPGGMQMPSNGEMPQMPGGAQNASEREQSQSAEKETTEENAEVSKADESGENNSADTSDSYKGIKAGRNILISGGTIEIDSADDAVHSDGNLEIKDGELIISTGDDAIHAEKEVQISGGTITIQASYEGIEGNQILISDGVIDLTSSDDGMNASGGTAGFGQMGFMGGRRWENTNAESGDSSAGEKEDVRIPIVASALVDSSSGEKENNQIPTAIPASADSSSGEKADTDSTLPLLRITGGNIHVNAAGDGLDSNGNLIIDGGEIIVDGPENSGNGALDSGTESGGDCIVNGGTILALGASGMAESFSENSTQYSFITTFSNTFKEGDEVRISDSNGTVIFTYAVKKSGNSLVFSSVELKEGETYTIQVGEQSNEITINGIANGNSFSSGFGGRF